MAKLLVDVFSRFSNGKSGANKGNIQYGKIGDEVKIIADHDNVVIVENLKGNRFPVSKEKILL
jgi:uncharacterized protein (DUF2249 family)